MHSYFITIKKKKHIFCWECGMWSYLDVEFFIWWIYLTHSIISSKRFKNNNTITDLAMNNYLWWGISFNHTFEENRYWSVEKQFWVCLFLFLYLFTWKYFLYFCIIESFFYMEVQVWVANWCSFFLFLSMQNKILKCLWECLNIYSWNWWNVKPSQHNDDDGLHCRL